MSEEGDTITGWDGTIDGNPVENGNYIMVVTAETFNGHTDRDEWSSNLN